MYLGVDGGGTKTAFALIDKNGRLLAEHESATCYYLEAGIEGARQILEQGIKALVGKAGCSVADIEFGFFGLPAYGEDSKYIGLLDELPSGILAKERYRCDNDMVNGWAAAFGGNDGINIVAGTGSIAYGVRQQSHARCGGWGELFSDEGSAYWVACKGLQLFSRMSDGRSDKGPLYELIKSTYQIHSDLDMCGVVFSDWGAERSKIAQVSAVVYQAAMAGDLQAIAIFAEAAKELAEIVHGVGKALNYQPEEEILVSYSGGVFKSGPLLLEPFSQHLQQYSKQYRLQSPAYSPVMGAALYALKLAQG